MKPGKAWIALLIAPPLTLLSLNAGAVPKTWNLPGLCTPTASFKNGNLVTTSSPYANAPGTCAGTAELLSVSALSDTGLAGLLQSAYIGDYGSGGLGVTSTAGPTKSSTSSTLDGTAGTLASGTTVDTNNGITSESTGTPNHAMDNENNKEAILLTFSTPVLLSSFQIGWPGASTGYDSDMSVLKYVGAGDPGLSSKTYSTLTTNSWAIVGNYANVPINTTTAVGGSAVKSSYWLISAYNSAFGTGTNLNNSNDYVKLLSIVADVPTTPPSQAPEPSSLLLMAIGMAGLTALRRRRPA